MKKVSRKTVKFIAKSLYKSVMANRKLSLGFLSKEGKSLSSLDKKLPLARAKNSGKLADFKPWYSLFQT